MGLLPSGYDCTNCGEHHEFGTWVYSHWDREIVHTCLTCNTQHIVCQGEADVIHKATA